MAQLEGGRGRLTNRSTCISQRAGGAEPAIVDRATVEGFSVGRTRSLQAWNPTHPEPHAIRESPG